MRHAEAWRRGAWTRTPIVSGTGTPYTQDSMPKGKNSKRGANSAGSGPSTSDDATDEGDADTLFYLRTKYSLLGKGDWWWLMDESLAEIHRRLETENFVVIDGFIPRDATRELRDEIHEAHKDGHLTPGVLAGGKAGNATQYTMKDVRGDHVGWFNGTETKSENSSDNLWRRLPEAMKKADTLVNELGQLGGDAKHVGSRSKAMCTVYPGQGARYIRHVDNPGQNGRLLTALLYLNPEWEEGDGGELRVFRCLHADSADASSFSDCDGRSLAVADGFHTTERTEDNTVDTTVIQGPKDIAEGVRDIVTLRGAEDEEANGDETMKNKRGAQNKKKPVRLTDVAPLGGRLVLFKSDARVPHEVLAASKPRYAMTLWYFHGEEVAAARRGPAVTEEDRKAQEEKIAREIETMTLWYGGGADASPEVHTRPNPNEVWTPVTKSDQKSDESDEKRLPALPTVNAPCEASWEEQESSRTLVVLVLLPEGTKASACSAEVEVLGHSGSRLILDAPGLPNETHVDLPNGADPDTVAVTLVKKPRRALVVRVACASVEARQDVPVTETKSDMIPVSSLRDNELVLPSIQSHDTRTAQTDTKDCVGVGGMLHWSSETAFTAMPVLPAKENTKAVPRGVDLRGAVDWDDFASTRWSLAGRDHERPTLTPHALDGLSFPVTLAWATQQPLVREAIQSALSGATVLDLTSAAAAAGADETTTCGDGDPATPPLTILIAGASAHTEQFLLEHTEYWSECVIAAPAGRGGAHLAFVGPDVDDKKRKFRRLAPSLTASLHRTTTGAYLSRLTSTAPCVVIGFNTGLGGGGGALARAWAPDLVLALKRPNTPLVLTCANEFADLRGELGVFRALGARLIVQPARNPYQAYTHAIGDGVDKKKTVSPEEKKRSSCANSFTYAVFGFEKGKGPDSGLSDAQLCALAAGAAERAAGKAWDALGMSR